MHIKKYLVLHVVSINTLHVTYILANYLYLDRLLEMSISESKHIILQSFLYLCVVFREYMPCLL